MNRIIKESAILFAITLIAGLALGAVYGITKEPIKQVQAKQEQDAYKVVMQDAADFSAVEGLTDESNAKVFADAGITGTTISKVLEAKDGSGNVIGYVMNITNSEGYGGDINFIMGIKVDGTVTGYQLLTINETAGLGQKAKESKFKDQFNDKLVEKFSVQKTPATSDEQIEAISGATITSNAMTNGVNGGIALFKTLGGAN